MSKEKNDKYIPTMKKGKVVFSKFTNLVWFIGEGPKVEDRVDILLLEDFDLYDAIKLRDDLDEHILECVGLKEKYVR